MNTRTITTAVIGLATLLTTSAPALAQVKTMPKRSTSTATEKIAPQRATSTKPAEKMQERGTEQITHRIEALKALMTRIQGMKNLTSDQKTNFANSIQTEIKSLTDLATKIQSETSSTTLKEDIKSIGPDYRIYMLVMPQISIMSGVDRINSLVTSLTTISNKVQSRITNDTVLSSNATIKGALADLTTKLADASSKAATAQAEVQNLKPDQGDKTVQQSNLAALKDARSKLQAAQQDIVAARKDIRAAVDVITSTKSVNQLEKGKVPKATTTKSQ